MRYKLAIASYKVRIARYKLTIRTFFLRFASYKVRIVRYKLAILRTYQPPPLPSKLDFNSQLLVYITEFWLYNSQLRVYISQFWEKSELQEFHDINCDIKSPKLDFNSQLLDNITELKSNFEGGEWYVLCFFSVKQKLNVFRKVIIVLVTMT